MKTVYQGTIEIEDSLVWRFSNLPLRRRVQYWLWVHLRRWLGHDHPWRWHGIGGTSVYDITVRTKDGGTIYYTPLTPYEGKLPRRVAA